jgi:Zn-dependent protease with chaperone function
MARKVRRRKVKAAPGQVKISWGQVRFPGESQHYWLAVVALIWACILLAAAGFFATEKQYWQWIYLGAWPIGSLLLVNYLADKPRREQIKAIGPSCLVRPNNHPHLHRQLAEVCAKLAVSKLPAMCLVTEDVPYLYSMAGGNGTIILTTELVSLLRPEELEIMLAREVAHIKYGHLRLERALTYIHTASPVVSLAFAPVRFWATLMGEWLDVSEYTADRAAVLVSGDPGLVNATLVKAAAAADPQSGMTADYIDEFLHKPKGHGGLNSSEVEQSFKLNRFIESQPNLRDRIAQVAEFYSSEEGQEMLEKLATGKLKPKPSGAAAKPAPRAEAEDVFTPGRADEGQEE